MNIPGASATAPASAAPGIWPMPQNDRRWPAPGLHRGHMPVSERSGIDLSPKIMLQRNA